MPGARTRDIRPWLAFGAIALSTAWAALLFALYLWDRAVCTPQTCDTQESTNAYFFAFWLLTQFLQALYVIPCTIWLASRWAKRGFRSPERLGVLVFVANIGLGTAIALFTL